jgi:MFS superfamily sulfate permease-like transporter
MNSGRTVQASTTLPGAMAAIFRRPFESLVLGWNWKSALYSSSCRGGVFFAANVNQGVEAASGAMLAEFAYRALTAGFYGSITQAFRKVEPQWKGAAAALGLMLTLSHSLEFMIHWLRHTPNLGSSILASIVFTTVSTLFNLHAMRRGIFVTGSEGRSLKSDLRSLPRVLLDFVSHVPSKLLQNLELP